MIRFHKLDKRAKTPTKGSEMSAGYDLFPLEDIVIPAHATNMTIPIGISVDLTMLSQKLPKYLHAYGRVAPRSSLAYNYGVDVLAGVIDRDYRGQIHVILTNPNDRDVVIPYNKAIAQLIIEVHMDDIEWNEVSSLSELSDTMRGSGKFGSTDKK